MGQRSDPRPWVRLSFTGASPFLGHRAEMNHKNRGRLVVSPLDQWDGPPAPEGWLNVASIATRSSKVPDLLITHSETGAFAHWSVDGYLAMLPEKKVRSAIVEAKIPFRDQKEIARLGAG